MEQVTPEPEIEVSQAYILSMQKDGMFDANKGIDPEFPDNPYYMVGYRSVKK